MGTTEKRISELGIKLPTANLKGKGLTMIQKHENLLFCSGNGPLKPDGTPMWTGKLGSDLTVEEGYQAARQCGINLLGKLKDFLGDLDKVDQIIKVFGLVASEPDFYKQPQVIHGFSDLMVDIFGQRGLHARSAMGTNVLPLNIPVEVEMIVRIKE